MARLASAKELALSNSIFTYHVVAFRQEENQLVQMWLHEENFNTP